MTQNPLHDIATWRDRDGPSGIPPVCSAHPMVLEASMRAALPRYEAVRGGRLVPRARSFALASVESVLQDYIAACEG